MTYHYKPKELAHSDTPHTCSRFNPERPPAQWVQDGWKVEWSDEFICWVRVPVMQEHRPKWLDLPCQYSDRKTATTCKHCPRRES